MKDEISAPGNGPIRPMCPIRPIHPVANGFRMLSRMIFRYILILVLVLSAAGCSRKGSYPPYSPHENLLSIASEFQILGASDPYRDPPVLDLLGRNLARSTLLRLANYESLHPGRFTPEVTMLKGRALEWLADYENAERNYLECATVDTELRDEALRRAEFLRRIIAARTAEISVATLEELARALEAQSASFARLQQDFDVPFYKALAQREQEATDVQRAELLVGNRWVFTDGENQAREALAATLSNHRLSHRALSHALRLARFHRELAEQEMRLNPPETVFFDAERFRRHHDAALDLLYRVSQADGRPERIIAKHELDALLALGEQVLR